MAKPLNSELAHRRSRHTGKGKGFYVELNMYAGRQKELVLFRQNGGRIPSPLFRFLSYPLPLLHNRY